MTLTNSWDEVDLPDLPPERDPPEAQAVYPSAIAVDNRGRILLLLSVHFGYWDVHGEHREAATARVIRIEPESGAIQTITRDGLLHPPSDPIGQDESPADFDVDAQGNLLVVQRGEVIRVNSRTGTQTSVSRFGRLDRPVSAAVNPDTGDVFVLEKAGNIIKVNGDTLVQSVFFDDAAYFRRPPDEIISFGLASLRDILFRAGDLWAYGGGCVARFPGDGADPVLISDENSLNNLAYVNTGGTMDLDSSGSLVIAGENIEAPNALFRVPVGGGAPAVFALLRDDTVAALTVVGEFEPLAPNPAILRAQSENGILRLNWQSQDSRLILEQSLDLQLWEQASGSVVIEGGSHTLELSTSEPARYFRLTSATVAAP